jgi:hypothetical protein
MARIVRQSSIIAGASEREVRLCWVEFQAGEHFCHPPVKETLCCWIAADTYHGARQGLEMAAIIWEKLRRSSAVFSSTDVSNAANTGRNGAMPIPVGTKTLR